MLKKIFFFLLGLFFFSPGPIRGEVVDRIVTIVNNEIITLSELEETGKGVLEQVRQTALPSDREEKLKKARGEILEQLIENKLLEMETKSKKIEVSERDTDAAIENFLRQNRLTENDLKIALAKEGITYSGYRNQMRNELEKMRLINKEIKSKIVIKEEDLKKAYSAKLQEFMEPLEVKVQQIFFYIPPKPTEEQISVIQKEIWAIRERAQKGEDFTQLAKSYSQDPLASEGGILGYFRQNELMPELGEIAFKLKPGELSEPIRSPMGFHLIRVLERKGGEPKPFAEVQNDIREEMIQAESERLFQDWMKALKAKAYIEIRL